MTVVIADGTVRRPAAAWTPAVHALLRHYEAVGFEGAPRVLGIDHEGREVLGFIAGDVPGKDAVPVGEHVVRAVGAFLREMHDAQAGFDPQADATWQLERTPPVEVICHNDALGSNYVFRDGRPYALIDWELAAPGPRLVDVATAAAWLVPLRPDEGARRYGVPTDRRTPRLRALADGYGLDDARRDQLLNTARALFQAWYETYRVRGAVERLEPWAERWDAGRGEAILANIAWLDDHRAELERWLG